MHDIAEQYGYEWEPHQVETEDGWVLSLIRITAVNGEPIKTDKPPLLMQHGAYSSGLGWFTGLFEVGLPGLLAE